MKELTAHATALLFGLLLLPPTMEAQSSACIPPLAPPSSAQPAHTAHLYVIALSHADRAHRIGSAMTDSGGGSNPFLAMRLAASEARCAEMLAGMVSESADSSLRLAMRLAELSFGQIAKSIDDIRESVLREMDGRHLPARELDIRAAAAQLADQGWRDLVVVTLAVADALKSESDTLSLVLSEAERTALLSQISSSFEGQIEDDLNLVTNHARASGWAIRDTLNKRKY